jgi:HD-like signal output (HDOD) protein
MALKASYRLSCFSVALPQALSLCAREDELSVSDLTEVVDRDVVITGNLLSLANSAFYSRGAPTSNLRQAIVRLGIRKARNVLIGLSIVRSVSSVEIPGKWSSVRFNEHSLATAMFCDLIGQHALTQDSEWAFGAGLLHDIGLLLIGAAFPDRLGALADHSANDLELTQHERELLGFTHFELGAEFLAKWNYPPAVAQAVRNCPDVPPEFARPLSLAVAVKIGSLLADSNHLAMPGAAEADDSTPELLNTLQVKNPVKFLEGFQHEWQAFQECSAPRLVHQA